MFNGLVTFISPDIRLLGQPGGLVDSFARIDRLPHSSSLRWRDWVVNSIVAGQMSARVDDDEYC
jgi:hypothetical protein